MKYKTVAANVLGAVMPPKRKSRTPLTDEARELMMSFDMWAVFAEKLEIELNDAKSMLDIHIKRLRQAEGIVSVIAEKARISSSCHNKTCGEISDWRVALVNDKKEVRTFFCCRKCLTSTFWRATDGVK